MRRVRRRVCWTYTRPSINHRESHSRANDAAKISHVNTIWIGICCTRIAMPRNRSRRYLVMCAANYSRERIICANTCVVTSANHQENETISVRTATNHFMDLRCSSEYRSIWIDDGYSIAKFLIYRYCVFQHSHSYSYR